MSTCHFRPPKFSSSEIIHLLCGGISDPNHLKWLRRWDQANSWRLQLSKYPVLNNFEKQTSVPKVYAFLGLVGLYFFLVFFNIGGEFLVNFAGFIIPGYYSLEALFSTNKVDDTQWLTVRASDKTASGQTMEDTDQKLVLGCLCLPHRF